MQSTHLEIVSNLSFSAHELMHSFFAIPLANKVRREFQPAEKSPELKKLSLHGMLAKAEFGGIQADLLKAREGCTRGERKAVQELSARSLAVVSVVDHFLDETGMPVPEKLELLNDMKTALNKGSYREQKCPQLRLTAMVCVGLNNFFGNLRDGQRFLNTFSDLADAAISQIQNPGSLEASIDLGSETAALAAILPQVLLQKTNARLLQAARYFGGFVQLMDDIQDYKHDQKMGLNTFITAAKNPAIAAADARDIAKALYKSCMSLLTPKEQAVYNGMRFCGAVNWQGLTD